MNNLKEHILFFLKSHPLYKELNNCEYELRASNDFARKGWNTTFKYLDIICFNKYDLDKIDKSKKNLEKVLENKLDLGKNDSGVEYILNIKVKLSMNNLFEKQNDQLNKKISLQLIGKGSYAEVFKYKDSDYDTYFVVKKAKSNLDIKNLKRFKREFEIMKELNSPYVVKVYKYDDKNNQYTMELLDYTLEKYLEKNNQIITLKNRFNIVNQIIRGFKYLEKKMVLHRDISPRNILIKKYENLIIVKISDFGLVKLENSFLTSDNTEFRGSLNDQSLSIEGFKEYEVRHETFALTKLIVMIISGKFNLSKIKDLNIKEFLNKGVSEIENRYQNILELEKAVNQLREKLE